MKERTATLPCTLCARLLDQRADKNSKPYFVCEPCGTQFFIRGTAGRERLAEIFRNGKTLAKANVKRKHVVIFDDVALQHDLMQLQSYIETFCADEMVIPEEPFEVTNAVLFPEWSGKLCDLISKAIDARANG
jgi:hypothetical protein